VLEGEFSVLLGERTLRAGPEAFVHVPKGTLHAYKNTSDTPGRMNSIAHAGWVREALGRAGSASDTAEKTASGRSGRDREGDRPSAQVSPPDSPSAAMKRI
jgi:Cupin domain